MVTTSDRATSRITPAMWYIIALFAVTNALSYADRAMFTLLIQPIKQAFLLSDVQIGLLSGLSFGLAYSIFSLPVGWLSDFWPRNRILAAGALIWTSATATCGIASSLLTLFICRIGVGVGEAVVYPTAMTTVSDVVPRQRVSHAIGTVITGGFVGSGLALIGGGLILRTLGEHGHIALPLIGVVSAWRFAFLAAAVPGFFLAPLLVFTVRDPRHAPATADRLVVAIKATRPTGDVWAFFKAHRRLILSLILGMGCCNLFGSGQGAWMPTFLVRTYEMKVGTVGLISGFVGIGCGCIGPLLAAFIASALMAKGHQDALVRTAVGCILVALPCSVLAPLAPNAAAAIALQAVASIMLQGPYTMAAATIQEVVPAGMRGQFTAAYLFFINTVGLGFGPLIIGLITDHVLHNEQHLRYAIALFAGVALPCSALLLVRVLTPLREFGNRSAAVPVAAELTI